MEPPIVGLSQLAPTMLVVSPAHVTQVLLLMSPMLDAGTRMSAQREAALARPTQIAGIWWALTTALAR